ncbi:MAG: zinc ABC transporter substrate-binding protein [bacterium]|nr:zinc ABC transporter substrate-binding protein [bacterium]
MTLKRMLILLVLLLMSVTGWVNARQATPVPCATAEINVVATIGMIADVAQNIGGTCAEVTALMGAGVDPHLYTATERDVETLFNADLILYGGLNLEARLIDVFEQIESGMGTPVVAVSENVPEEERLQEIALNATDPHVWMDVALWRTAAEAIRDAFTAYAPQHEAFFAANADAYFAELDALDAYAEEQIALIPEDQRVLVTAHDAFQYFGRAYGIDVYAPQGITTESEVGIQDIRETIELIIDRDIPAIFIETSVSPDVIEAIIEGAAAQGHTVIIGGALYSDAMGDADTEAGTYIGMIRHNVDTIVTGLLGEAAE